MRALHGDLRKLAAVADGDHLGGLAAAAAQGLDLSDQLLSLCDL